MSLHQCNHWYLCFCLLSPFCNAVLRPRCRQAAALWFSKSGRTFANIVWISLLLLYSALYLVWLVLTLYFLLFSYIKQHFENIVWISLLLLYSALYLVWLVPYIFYRYKHRLHLSRCFESLPISTWTNTTFFLNILDTFTNIVWISLLLLYSALYLVSLVLTLHFLLFVHKTAFWNHCLDRSTLFSIYLYLLAPSGALIAIPTY